MKKTNSLQVKLNVLLSPKKSNDLKAIDNVFFFLFSFHAQGLMYVSDKPNYSLIQTLLDSLQHELRLLVDPPDGSKEHPATTCLELWLCHPEYSSGQFLKQSSNS